MNRIALLAVLAGALTAAGLPQFHGRTIAKDLTMGYQLVVADLNGDGKPDIIAVDERGTELAWYENPNWERHILIANVPRTINLDVFDYNGDGIPEIAMGHHFETDPARSIADPITDSEIFPSPYQFSHLRPGLNSRADFHSKGVRLCSKAVRKSARTEPSTGRPTR